MQHAGGEAAGQQQGGAYFKIVASPYMTGIAQERRRGWAPACQARGPGRMGHGRGPATSDAAWYSVRVARDDLNGGEQGPWP